jgi:hypothetical protein
VNAGWVRVVVLCQFARVFVLLQFTREQSHHKQNLKISKVVKWNMKKESDCNP